MTTLLPEKKKIQIGWRECVDLPTLKLKGIKAKIDTGARTSALHAEDQQIFVQDGVRWVRFMVPDPQSHALRQIKAPLHEERDIKNTSGVAETRLVIRSKLRIGGRLWTIDVSLADRAEMAFDLILGRTAIRRRRILVDPGQSYLVSEKPAEQKITGESQ